MAIGEPVFRRVCATGDIEDGSESGGGCGDEDRSRLFCVGVPMGEKVGDPEDSRVGRDDDDDDKEVDCTSGTVTAS